MVKPVSISGRPEKENFIPTYKIAHITGAGVDVVVFPVNGSFPLRPKEEQDSLIKTFQAKSKAAGFKGNVVVVWDAPDGKINFRAPLNQHEYFKNIGHDFINANLNKTISW